MCAMIGAMSSVQDNPQKRLGRINVPAPTASFSAQELVMFRRMTRERLRRAEKRAKRSEEHSETFTGMNANEVHARRLREMDEKIVAWLTQAWPVVAAATGADEATGLAGWLESSLPESSRPDSE